MPDLHIRRLLIAFCGHFCAVCKFCVITFRLAVSLPGNRGQRVAVHALVDRGVLHVASDLDFSDGAMGVDPLVTLIIQLFLEFFSLGEEALHPCHGLVMFPLLALAFGFPFLDFDPSSILLLHFPHSIQFINL